MHIARYRLLLLSAALLLTLQASAQYTQTVISASRLLDQNRAPLNGSITITITDGADTPVTYTPCGGSPTAATYTAKVTAGVIIGPLGGQPGPFMVPALVCFSPSVYYDRITWSNGSTQFLYAPLNNLNSQSYSLDSFQAQTNVVLQGLGAPAFVQHCQPGAVYTDTTGNSGSVQWVCSPIASLGQNQWTQNPATGAYGNRCPATAVAAPFIGDVYCLKTTEAWATTNYIIGTPATLLAGPLTAVPLRGGPPIGGAGGDLSGTYPDPTVSGLMGVPFCAGYTPSASEFVQYTTGGTPDPCYAAATATAGGGLSGMTAGQVPIAATATTVTSSKPLAGSGTGVTTGPVSSTNGDCAQFTGTGGQIADSGSGCGDTITSPNATLLIGGTPAHSTVDINLAKTNTWTAPVILKVGPSYYDASAYSSLQAACDAAVAAGIQEVRVTSPITVSSTVTCGYIGSPQQIAPLLHVTKGGQIVCSMTNTTDCLDVFGLKCDDVAPGTVPGGPILHDSITLSSTAVVRNVISTVDQTGLQEAIGVSGCSISGNAGGGAIVTRAVVDYSETFNTSTFTNSFISAWTGTTGNNTPGILISDVAGAVNGGIGAFLFKNDALMGSGPGYYSSGVVIDGTPNSSLNFNDITLEQVHVEFTSTPGLIVKSGAAGQINGLAVRDSSFWPGPSPNYYNVDLNGVSGAYFENIDCVGTFNFTCVHMGNSTNQTNWGNEFRHLRYPSGAEGTIGCFVQDDRNSSSCSLVNPGDYAQDWGVPDTVTGGSSVNRNPVFEPVLYLNGTNIPLSSDGGFGLQFSGTTFVDAFGTIYGGAGSIAINGGFELNTTLPPIGWSTQDGGVFIGYDTSTPYAGKQSLMLNGGTSINGGIWGPLFPASPGQSYTLSAAIKAASGVPYVEVCSYKSDGVTNITCGSTVTYSGSGSWQYAAGSTYTTPALTAYVRVVAEGRTVNQAFELDSISAVLAGTPGVKSAGPIESDVSAGTAPLIIASTTQVANLDSATAGKLDTSGSGNQVWSMDSGGTTQGWHSSSGGGAFSGGLGSSYQDVTEIAAPSNPSSSNDRLYMNSSTHLLGCITSSGGNCMPSTGSGANAALSNLSGVSINTALLAQTGVDIGSSTNPFRNWYLYGSGTYGTNYFEFTGTPTGNRIITIPDATDTLVNLASTQSLSNKTVDGVTPTVMGYVDPTGSIQTQLNGKAATNASTTGSAASLSISGQTGLLLFTGLTSINRIKTVRDAADTILELGGSYTPTGTWTGMTFVTPALGTPASGVITNLSGTCASCSIGGHSASTANALTVNNSGSGDASSFTFDGSVAHTLSWNSIGAAPLASPTFTGTPAAPTATGGTNTTQLATTQFVQAAIAGTVSDGAGSTTAGQVSVATGTAHQQSYNANAVLGAGGNFTTYDGLTTAGLGVSTVLGVSDVTAQSASQTTVNLIASTGAAGHYMVRIYVDQNGLCTTGTGSVYATVSWTDATHAHTAQTVPLTLANTAVSTTAGFIDAAIPLWSATASAITYTTTYTGCTTGTGTYDLHAEIERTN